MGMYAEVRCPSCGDTWAAPMPKCDESQWPTELRCDYCWDRQEAGAMKYKIEVGVEGPNVTVTPPKGLKRYVQTHEVRELIEKLERALAVALLNENGDAK